MKEPLKGSAALKAAVTGNPSDVAIAATSAGKDPVITALTAAMGKIRNVLPSLLTPERMLRLVTNELRMNHKLAQVAKKNPASLVNAVCVAARCGLEIGGPNPQGHLVPYGDEIVFLPDYRGKLELMRRSGQLASFTLELVHTNDKFSLKLGFKTEVEHEPLLDGERGPVRLGYFAATLKNGETMFVWMSHDDIEKIRKKSKMGNSGAWVNDWNEMAKKTVVHRASKIMPMSTELRLAVAAENAADDGRTARLADESGDSIIEGESIQVFAEMEQINTSTGEITHNGEIALTYADCAAAINGSKTTDQLDLAIDLINGLKDASGVSQGELHDLAKVRRLELAK